MSYKTPTFYGFKVNNNLSDVIDKNLALKRLTLNIGDIDIIRGANSIDGASREDLIAISNLDEPLYKILDRYIGDTGRYRGILDDSAGVDAALRGNLDVLGSIGGSAIRFPFIEYTVQINYTTGSGTFILNEKIVSGENSAIVKEVGSGFIIVKNIIGDVTTGSFTGSYSGATLTVASASQEKDLRYADISTSRVSAWSTSQPPVTIPPTLPSDADPIFYGGQLSIKNTQVIDPNTNLEITPSTGAVSVSRIIWGEVARARLKQPNGNNITGEIPTHTIDVNVNGQVIKMYAMKSIPLKLRGFFKRFDGTVSIEPIPGLLSPRVSWRIVNVADSNDVQLFAEQGFASSSYLPYRALNAAERDIEIYYHPDFITGLFTFGMGITELPAAQLPALRTLDVRSNNIKDMPDIKFFAPSLETLSIQSNNLYLATDPNLRKFTKEVADRLPSTLKTLNVMGTFFGSIRQTDANGNLIETDLGGANSYSVIEKKGSSPESSLTTFNCSRGSGAFFNPDDYDSLSHLPSMPDTLITYSARHNDFRRIPARGVKNLPNLVNFDVYGNGNLLDSEFALSSNNLVNVRIGDTRLVMPNLSLRPNLVTFEGQYGRNLGPFHANIDVDTSYKFSGCGALVNLFTYAAGITGFIPKFKGNTNLRHVDLYAAQGLTGGRPDNGEHGYPDGKTHVMFNDTFNDARNISFFRVLSNSLLVGKVFEKDTFKNLPSLSYLYWYSYGRTGSGLESAPIPDVSSCPNLQTFIMPVNNFTGPAPSMSTNRNIRYIDLSSNRLSSAVPTYNNALSLQYVFLNNNQISSFPGFENTPNLIFAYLHNNQIIGNIPMLGNTSKAPNLRQLFLFNNQLSGYTTGSFAGLTRIQRLDVARNALTEFDLNNIVDDLFTNYQNAPRRGVNINLQGQSNAVGYSPSIAAPTEREKEVAEKIEFLRANGWTISIG